MSLTVEELGSDEDDPDTPPLLSGGLQNELIDAEKIMEDYWTSRFALQKIEAVLVSNSPIGRKTVRMARLLPNRRSAMIKTFIPLFVQIIEDVERDDHSSQPLAWAAWLERRIRRRFRSLQDGEVMENCFYEILESAKKAHDKKKNEPLGD